MPGAGRHLDRRVDDDRRRRVAAVERRGVDEGLERRARLAQRLGGAVEDARLVGEAALHGEDAPGLDVHRHEAALDLRHLAVGPVVEGAVLLDRLDEDHVADLPQVGRALRRAQAVVGVAHPRPARVGEAEELPSPASGTPSMPMRAALSPSASTTAGCQPAMSRGTWVAASARRQLASSAGSKVARVDLGHRAAVDPEPRSYFSSPSRSASAADVLELGVHGGADRQAAGEELLVAELGRELAADLVGEIVARRHGRPRPRSRSPPCTVSRSSASRGLGLLGVM